MFEVAADPLSIVLSGWEGGDLNFLSSGASGKVLQGMSCKSRAHFDFLEKNKRNKERYQ